MKEQLEIWKSKKQWREEIAGHIQTFLLCGGVINNCHFGENTGLEARDGLTYRQYRSALISYRRGVQKIKSVTKENARN